MPKGTRKTTTRAAVTEARPLQVTEAAASTGRLPIVIATPGWGSSGYYSAEVLEAAATAKVFPAGTQSYIDHPGEIEEYDRPERSIRDLAAVLTEDATWDDGQLVAEVQVFGPYVEMLTDPAFADAIGMSMRAYAESSHGEAEGRKGKIITKLVEAISIDFVTRAGRGGRVLTELMESARPAQVTERAIAHGVAEATANDTREALQDVLRAEYGGEKSWVWVRDFDESTVWFEHETPDEMGTYAQGYELDDDTGAATLTGDRTEVRARIQYVPVTSTESDPAPAGRPNGNPSKEDTMPQIEEARLRQLEEAAGRAEKLETERNQATERATAAESERDQLRAREAATTRARARVVEANADLAPATVDRIVAEATRDVPLTDAGQLDEAALDTRVDDARTAEETYLAGLAEARGDGKIAGFGASTGDGDGEVSVDDFDALFTTEKA